MISPSEDVDPQGSGSLLVRAMRGEAVERTPVWFMRQAGRSLPEYRALRRSGGLLELCHDPALAAEVTMQPVRRHGVDAAILFSDIVFPLHAIGVGVEIRPGVGPVLDQPVRTRADLERLRPFEPDVDAPEVGETVRLVREGLEVPVIGFAGAPFTVASYLVEGGPSKVQARTRALMLSDPELWTALCERLADHAVSSLEAQVRAGAAAVQLFDSWAGSLSAERYEAQVLPVMRSIIERLRPLGVPVVSFALGGNHLLELLAAAGPDVVGCDWRTPLSQARARLGDDIALQGNLDPASCLADVAGHARLRGRRPRRRAGSADTSSISATAYSLKRTRASSPRWSSMSVTDPRSLRRPPQELMPADSQIPVGVLVMAYGTPESPEDVERYYTHIRRGRAPEPELLVELQDRYNAIGGISPLLAITRAQVDGIGAALEEAEPGRFVTALGQKHSAPFIEDGVAELLGPRRRADRRHRPRAPLLDDEHRPVRRPRRRPPPATGAGRASCAPGIWSPATSTCSPDTSRTRSRRSAAPDGCEVLFTAHSLPQRILEAGDPYPDQLAETAAALAERADIDVWSVAWQSAGRTADPWIGPGRPRRRAGAGEVGHARDRRLLVRLRRRPPGSPLRPRHRDEGPGRRARASRSPGPRPRTPIRRSRATLAGIVQAQARLAVRPEVAGDEPPRRHRRRRRRRARRGAGAERRAGRPAGHAARGLRARSAAGSAPCRSAA